MERFIAFAMRFVRIEPDAPTIMPATMSAVLSSARPIAAADNPVNALSREITTGMSAPPIGSTTIKPSTAAASSSTIISTSASTPAITATAQPTAASSSTMFNGCCSARSVIGRPGRISCSFPNAISEPQKEIEPMSAANNDAIAI